MDLLLSFIEIFFLIIQEEKHREIGYMFKVGIKTVTFMNMKIDNTKACYENSRPSSGKQEYKKKKFRVLLVG